MITITNKYKSNILQQLMSRQKDFFLSEKHYESLSSVLTWKEFRKNFLLSYMKKEKGNKRLRKKKAIKKMKSIWQRRCYIAPITNKTNYPEILNQLITIQKLKEVQSQIYTNHYNLPLT